MVTVKLFGEARIKYHDREFTADVKSVQELVDLIIKRYSTKKKEVKQYVIYVNEVNISQLKMYHTPLNDGDVIMLLSPSAGG